jgi:HD-GYP domain-containing protein (c-di-GMP phosphodiesterase class II)
MGKLDQLTQIAALLPEQLGSRVHKIARELEAERSALNALQTIGAKISEIRDAFDLVTLFEDVLFEAVRLMGADRGALALMQNGQVRVVDSCSKDSHEDVQVSKMLLERVIAKEQAIITTNVQEELGDQASESILAFDILSVLAVPLRARDTVIGALYVDTQFTQRTFSESDAAILSTFAAQTGVAVTLASSIQQEHDNYVSLVKTMLTTLDTRDEYTAGHSERVGYYTRKLAERMGWKSSDLERALFAGWVHDIGKIGIRDQYLFKTGALNPEERVVLEQHTIIGERILKDSTKGFEGILPAVRSHHERWDGQGYPDNLSADEIPLLARMVGIADTFDAITTARPYSTPRTWQQAFEIIHREAGKQFDPGLVPLFIDAMNDTTTVKNIELINSGEFHLQTHLESA